MTNLPPLKKTSNASARIGWLTRRILVSCWLQKSPLSMFWLGPDRTGSGQNTEDHEAKLGGNNKQWRLFPSHDGDGTRIFHYIIKVRLVVGLVSSNHESSQ